MKKILLCLICFISLSFAKPHKIGVSIAPYKSLVLKICGPNNQNDFEIIVLASSLQDPHTFDPTPSHLLNFKDVDIWFLSNEHFESAVQKKLNVETKKLNEQKLTEDAHTFLSCQQLKKQALIIQNVLSEKYPEKKGEFEKNTQALLNELDTLDAQFKQSKTKNLMTLHDCFLTFCHDYDKTQLAIEHHGKEPTFYHLQALIQKAKEQNIQVILTQPQYDNKNALHLAKQLNITTKELNIYQEDLFKTLNTLVEILNGND